MDDIIEENDLMKRCSICGNVSLKCSFLKKLKSKDGLNPNCKVYRKKYYKKNLGKIKKTCLEKRDKVSTQQNEYKNNKIENHNNFRLFKKTRNQLYHALKVKV